MRAKTLASNEALKEALGKSRSTALFLSGTGRTRKATSHAFASELMLPWGIKSILIPVQHPWCGTNH